MDILLQIDIGRQFALQKLENNCEISLGTVDDPNVSPFYCMSKLCANSKYIRLRRRSSVMTASFSKLDLNIFYIIKFVWVNK